MIMVALRGAGGITVSQAKTKPAVGSSEAVVPLSRRLCEP
jgi:hypothetical protein